MSKDQSIGALVFAVCLLGIILYGWGVFLTSWNLLILELTGFIVVAGILGIMSWIGWTMVTTPPPKPLNEMENNPETEILEETKEES